MHISKKGLLTCLAMMTMSMGFLTSCSDEDDDTSVGLVTRPEAGDFDGTRLITVDYGNDEPIHFNYLADGTLHQIVDDRHGRGKLTFDYKTGTVIFSDGILEGKAHFTTNEKGYITEFNSSGSDEEGDKTVIYRFQYNSSDHLTNATCNQVVIYHATTKKETYDVTWKLTWNGDLLSSVERNEYDIKINNIYTYTDALDNRYMQYTSCSIGYIGVHDWIGNFMNVGLLGKGPSKYPSKSETKVYSDAQVLSSDTESITYELNSKGLVERENSNYSSDSYSDNYSVDYLYDGLSNASASAASNKVGAGNKRHKNSRNHISPFGRKK